MKNRKIAIDVDEVLVDLMNPLLGFHNDRYGSSLKREYFKTFNLNETWGGTYESAEKKIYEFFHSTSFEKIIPLQGSQEAVRILSENNDLVTATSRPEYMFSRTIKMLIDNYPKTFRDFHFTYQFPENKGGRKRNICLEKKADIIIDDLLENVIKCSDVVDLALLFDCPWNQTNDSNLPNNVIRVKNWGEIMGELG